MLYRKFKRIFSDKDVVAIVAEYKSNPNRSNKGGKTTILEAIRYALCGSSRADKEVDLIHENEKMMKVNLTLIDGDGKKIRIERGRDIKNHGILTVSGIDKKKEAQKAIDELIGYTKDEFLLTLFFKQMDINQFMELSPSDKKKYIMQWLNNLHWNALEKKVCEVLKQRKDELKSYESKLELLMEQKINILNLKSQLTECQEEIEEFQSEHDDLMKQKRSFEKKESSHDEKADNLQFQSQYLYDQLEDLSERIRENKRISKKLKNEKLKLKNLTSKWSHFLGKVTTEHRDESSQKLSSLRADLTKFKSQLKIMQKDFTGVCPILSESCDRITCDTKQLKDVRNNISKTEIAIEGLELELAHICQFLEAEAVIAASKTRIAQYRIASEGLKSLRAKYADIKRKKQKCDTKLQKLESMDLSSQLSETEERISEIEHEISGLNQLIGSCEQELRLARKQKKQIVELKKQIAELRIEISDLQYVAFMFGKNGIPSQEIENAFDEVEETINMILEGLYPGLQCQFQADRKLQTWEDYCTQCGAQFPKTTRARVCSSCNANRLKKRKDELQIRVIDGGRNESFSMESGGGKTLISLATRLAWVLFKQRRSGSNFNVLFLDEPDAALDVENKKSFIKLLTHTLNKLGIEQIFWISHDKNIQESIPNVLKVIRYEKHSKAVWM